MYVHVRGIPYAGSDQAGQIMSTHTREIQTRVRTGLIWPAKSEPT